MSVFLFLYIKNYYYIVRTTVNHALSPQEPVKKTSNLQKIGPHKFL